MAWRRVSHPSEVVNVGDEIDVKVLKFDRERMRVSLGLKQLGEDPWVQIAARYPVGARIYGTVTNLADYGSFVEIEEGVEGLVHVSEMDWTNKNINPGKICQVGDEVEVMVLDIDEERRRISLGMKQCKPNPWDEFAATHNKGDKIEGRIKSITDFGIFVGLEGGIDGLVHLSDISWDQNGEDVIREFKKGDEVEAVVLSVDPERERISLGIKQLDKDPLGAFLADYPKGSMIKGTVREVDAKKVEDARSVLKEGDEIEARIVGIDRKTRVISLSVKAKDAQEERKAVKQYSDGSQGEGGTTSLGDLLKEQLENK
jgi:small subunit ribosomal protein S1